MLFRADKKFNTGHGGPQARGTTPDMVGKLRDG